MICPYCQTENREDRETCYACDKDISTLRMVVNKARQHYNDALEHAERNHSENAIEELKQALALDNTLVNAHVVLGTLYARDGRFQEARDCWTRALELQPELARAHDYLGRVESVQAVLPTLSIYRWAAMFLFLVSLALAVGIIYLSRPERGEVALASANASLTAGEYGKAVEQIEQATILAKPGSAIHSAATTLNHALQFDLQERIRVIEDLARLNRYPEALQKMKELEAVRPDGETSAALSIIRRNVTYYYRQTLEQFYDQYERGQMDFSILQREIQDFLALAPGDEDADYLRQLLYHAETQEVQRVMDDLHRRFALDNNVEIAVQGLRDLAPRFENSQVFDDYRNRFIGDILNTLFNLFTGYLDQEEFLRASDLLNTIESVTSEFQDVVDVDVSGAVDLAWTVLRDSRRQFQFKQLDQYIDNRDFIAAEDQVWRLLQEPDLTEVETEVIRSYWQRVMRQENWQSILSGAPDIVRYYDMEISEDEASETLTLVDDLGEPDDDNELSKREQLNVLSVAAASALRLGMDDLASSYTARLVTLNPESTVTRTIEKLMMNAGDYATSAPLTDSSANDSTTGTVSSNDDESTKTKQEQQ